MRHEWLEREYMLLGEECVEKLIASRILVFGCGGVGSYALEALARSGVGHITAVDSDTVAVSNINRQLIADTSTVGKYKTEAVKERIAKINPMAQVDCVTCFADADNIPEIIRQAAPDYIIDAIDSVTSKILIIEYAKKNGIPIISSMGTGNKLDPSRLAVRDLSKTTVCPLARVMRRELGRRGIRHLDVVSSDEEPQKTGMRTPASVSFVPSVAGLLAAGHCIRKITGK